MIIYNKYMVFFVLAKIFACSTKDYLFSGYVKRIEMHIGGLGGGFLLTSSSYLTIVVPVLAVVLCFTLCSSSRTSFTLSFFNKMKNNLSLVYIYRKQLVPKNYTIIRITSLS